MEDYGFDISGINWVIRLFPLWNKYGYYNFDTKKCALSHIHDWECKMMEQCLTLTEEVST